MLNKKIIDKVKSKWHNISARDWIAAQNDELNRLKDLKRLKNVKSKTKRIY